MDITLEEARTLVALAQSRSFSLAARALKKGHSSVVYSLQSLENKTGLVLLDRTGYRTTLTPTGQQVLQSCRALLEKERDLQRLCSELALGWEPVVRIVLEGIVPFEPITQVLKSFLKDQIPTQFHVHADFMTGVESTFSQLKADMMISVLPPYNLPLQSIALPPVKAFLVAQKDHPLATSSKKHTISDLKKHAFVTVRGSDQRLNLSTQVLDQEASFHLNDFHSKKIAVLSGMGYGWLPYDLIEKELRSELLKIVRWERTSKHFFLPRLYYHTKNGLGRAGRLFIERLCLEEETEPA